MSVACRSGPCSGQGPENYKRDGNENDDEEKRVRKWSAIPSAHIRRSWHWGGVSDQRGGR